ncbi:hypothetical protein Ancab_005334 [Ancistrocladus abbreviatus]
MWEVPMRGASAWADKVNLEGKIADASAFPLSLRKWFDVVATNRHAKQGVQLQFVPLEVNVATISKEDVVEELK